MDYRRIRQHARHVRRLWQPIATPVIRDWLTENVLWSEKALTRGELDAYLRGDYGEAR